eukprot:TRINITY_DN26225_c0_g1_i1.p3 TRINITY_DN26225_c0_g1~~TRINITY_DN26225_c0_g1_i1.p3  ORF type:complete len:113 (+),score=15.02 TRINITY_DN26225_c0_g1_i1:215-553(+)
MSNSMRSAGSVLYRKLRGFGVDATTLRSAANQGDEVRVLTAGFAAVRRLTDVCRQSPEFGSDRDSIAFRVFRKQVVADSLASITAPAKVEKVRRAQPEYARTGRGVTSVDFM